MTVVGGPALALLRDWLPANTAPERPQIQLATVDDDGRPDVRTVLLSSWDERGFVFHTDSASRKAAQMSTHPSVALCVLWPGFTRQLVVRGSAVAEDRAGLDRAYADRSDYLRQLAWQNTVELAQEAQPVRAAAWSEFAAVHDVSELGPPPTWTGFVVDPDRLTFWRSDRDGPSHRVEYRAVDDGTWSEHQLAG